MLLQISLLAVSGYNNSSIKMLQAVQIVAARFHVLKCIDFPHVSQVRGINAATVSQHFLIPQWRMHAANFWQIFIE